MSMEKPFTVKALAERWSCSGSYIYKLIAEGKLRAFHLGGVLKRVSSEEVERWENGTISQGSNPTASELTGSDGSSINSASSGMQTGSGGVTDLASQLKKKREQSFMRSRGRT